METVTVSQAPAVSEAPAVATPAAGGATLATLLSAVQDLARFFLSLSGSSSLGETGGVAGVAAPASGVEVQLCPSASGGGAGEGDLPLGRRSVQGVGLLPLVLLLAVGRCPIGHILSLQRMPEPRLLLPELDVRLEVLLAIFTPLRRVTALLVLDLQVGSRGRPSERSVIAQVLVVDPPRLRVGWMTTGLVLSTRLTLTGMTLSGQSRASSGTSTPWKSLQKSHQLGVRLLLHRSMG